MGESAAASRDAAARALQHSAIGLTLLGGMRTWRNW